MIDESNAGERNEPEAPRELTEAERKAEQERQDIADGHRYMPQEMRDAREARDAKPARPKKPAKDLKDKGAAKPAGDRIAKVLARAGIASRREIERLIGLGQIAVNGRILETPAVLVKPADVITVEGRVVGKAEPTRLFRYHKPIGLVTTERDPEGRPTVFDKLPATLPRVLKVGRLDLNSEGLLLLTNDGELARALELPSSGWVRRYRARALGHTTQAKLDTLKHGTTVEGVIYGPIEATLDKAQEKADGRANVWITVAITEGKNREVRKVLESLGLKVNRLIRLAYGPFQLGNLEPGDVEEVGPRVIRELLSDMISPRNLPPENATQTEQAPRAPRGDDRPEGRRGGGDRFKGNDDRSARPARPRRDFAEKREFKDRDFDQRPRFEGDGESRDRKPYSDRPQRSGDFKKPYAARDGRDRPQSDRPYKKPYAAREGGEGRNYDRPRTPRSEGERPQGDRPYKKPYAAREGGEGRSYDRPRPPRSEGERPQGDRPYKKPYAAREGGEGRSYDRPRTPRFDGDRPQGDRPYKKPYANRTLDSRPPEGSEAGAYERAKREFGGADRKKPYAAREGGERQDTDRPRTPRFDGERPQSEGGYKKPYAKKPYAPRAEGEGRDFKPRGDRPAFGDKPRSPRPGGAKPGGFKSGPRPGGKPGGGKPLNRKPRDE